MNLLQAPVTSTPASADRPNSLVFIDGTVENAQQLALSTLPGVEAVLLDPTQDGIAQITAMLANRSNISGIHLIGHGSSGRLRLGSTTLSQETIAQYADSLNQWKTALTEDADLLLYGCNVASDSIGQGFVNQLSQLTDADVAASDDLTGNAALGGDWLLEYTTGLIEAPLALQVQAMQAYQDVLQDFQVSTADQLFNAINQANSTVGSDRIFITGSITLTRTLPVINVNPVFNNSIEFIGNGSDATIRGATGVNRLFRILNGNASFSNLTLQNGTTQGATGVNGGGGGLGAGGALLIENATVEINKVRFLNNTARGGNATGTAGRGGNGGNLGTGGDNGSAGGRGGGFEGSTGAAGGAGGLNGSQARRNFQGGFGQDGANGGFGEGGGGGGGGGGGQSFFFLVGDQPGQGGGGGNGGIPGFGGGGGGAGGGGGGADSSGFNQVGGRGGDPGFNQTFGGRGGGGITGASGGADADIFGGAGGAGGQGGGGAGLGGAIFVRSSNLRVRNSLFQNNTVIGGTGANAGGAEGQSIFGFESTVLLQNNQLDNRALVGTGSSFRDITPLVSVAASRTTLTEGNTLAFTFSLDEPAPATGLTINYQIGGTAIAAGNPNADHTFATGSITIPDGQRSFVLNGSILNDTIPELDKTLTFQLLAGADYQINSAPIAITIEDDDLFKIRGTGGNDILTGTVAAEQMNGNAGNDTIDGNGGNDFIFGDAGDDRILWDSGDGNDLINGGDGNDTLVFNCSNQGDQLIVQQAPNNTLQLLRTRPVAVDLKATNIERLEINCLNGSDGVVIRDTAATGIALIRVTGGGGGDTITGIGATATLELVGNNGDDVLTGGRRNDQLQGGVGRDSFVFNSNRAFNTADLGVDRILDFVRGSDRIVLDQTTFGNIATSQIAIVADDAIAATSAGLITYSRATGNLFFNQNGAAAGFGTGGQFATVQNNPALTVNDFQIVA